MAGNQWWYDMAKEYKREGNKVKVITSESQEIDINMLRDRRDKLRNDIQTIQGEIDIINAEIDFLKDL